MLIINRAITSMVPSLPQVINQLICVQDCIVIVQACHSDDQSMIDIASAVLPQGADPPSTRIKEGRNHLNEEITSLLPTGIGERLSQTILNFRTCSALAPM
jgi:hypothetical protein